MSMTFTKLFSSITESSIWSQDDATRLVWITMLAMADRHGRVWAAIPGLANRARVSIQATEKALQCFLSPDEYSRTKDFDGVRIEVIDGGWRLLNHQKYRDIRDEETRKEQNALAQARFRNKQSKPEIAYSKPEVSRSKPTRKPNAEAEAEAEASTKNHKASVKRFTRLQTELTARMHKCLNGQWENDRQKWMGYIKNFTGKAERVIAEVESAIRENRIKTTPAQFAQDTWEKFSND